MEKFENFRHILHFEFNRGAKAAYAFIVFKFVHNLLTPMVQCLLYLPLDPRFWSSIPAGVNRWIFSERKNPEYDFLRKASKAVGPMS